MKKLSLMAALALALVPAMRRDRRNAYLQGNDG
jgi:hypothetical protein